MIKRILHITEDTKEYNVFMFQSISATRIRHGKSIAEENETLIRESQLLVNSLSEIETMW